MGLILMRKPFFFIEHMVVEAVSSLVAFKNVLDEAATLGQS